MSVRFVLQAAYFLLLTRTLAATAYGQFVAAVVLIAFTNPFAALGVGHAIVRRASVYPSELGRGTNQALVAALVGGLVFAVALMPILHGFSLVDWSIAASILLLLSDAVGAPVSEICAQHFQAARRLHWSAVLQVLPSLGRFVGIATVAWFAQDADIADWVAAYSVSGILVAIGGVSLVAIFGVAPEDAPPSRRMLIRAGLPISTIASAQMIANDADKFLVARIVGGPIAGAYSAAYRLIDVAHTPLRALIYSSYTHFFRAGAAGRGTALRLAGIVGAAGLAYTLPASIALAALARPLTSLLGPTFDGASDVIFILAFLLPLRALQLPAGDALLGTGHTSLRAVAVVFAAAANVLSNILLLPSFGWRAAALSSVVTEVFLVLVFWSSLLILASRESLNYRPRADTSVGSQ